MRRVRITNWVNAGGLTFDTVGAAERHIREDAGLRIPAKMGSALSSAMTGDREYNGWRAEFLDTNIQADDLFAALKKQLGIQKKSDWYRVTRSDVTATRFGLRLLNRHSNSVQAILAHEMPDAGFLPWKFNQVPRNYWYEADHRVRYVRWLAATVDVHYSWLTVAHFVENHGAGLLARHYKNTPSLAVKEVEAHRD